ncbi:MAG: gluconate 2-dehydrogenase subunit 3 family protein [Pseudomonadota bacterium]
MEGELSGARFTRRLVLNAGVLAAAGVALSGCGGGNELHLETSDGAVFGFFSPAQAAVLSDVADIMIPKTGTVGATDTRTIEYLDQLMQTWAAEATKQEVTDFVEGLDSDAQTTHQNAYLDLSAEDRRELLQAIDRDSFSGVSEAKSMKSYRRVKWLIFHIHYTSEATNPDFILIPGQYRGDVSEAEYLAMVEENRY